MFASTFAQWLAKNRLQEENSLCSDFGNFSSLLIILFCNLHITKRRHLEYVAFKINLLVEKKCVIDPTQPHLEVKSKPHATF